MTIIMKIIAVKNWQPWQWAHLPINQIQSKLLQILLAAKRTKLSKIKGGVKNDLDFAIFCSNLLNSTGADPGFFKEDRVAGTSGL